MTRRLIIAIPFLAAVAVFLAGTTANAQVPGAADADAIPPWAWSVMVWGLLALVATLGSALVGLATKFAVGQLRRLDAIEASVDALRDEVKSLHGLAAGIGNISHRVDMIESGPVMLKQSRGRD